MPIKDLNPYQTRWHIKARVTTKKDMHHYVKDNKHGQVFSFDVVHNEGTETRITCFNDIASIHYDNIQVGAIYTIARATMKCANRFYNKLNSGIEITFMSNSKVSSCEDDSSILMHQIIFTSIDEII